MEVITMKQDEYRELIKQRMSEKRYIHSLNVEKAAVYLAKKYDADVEKAAVAGILHDVTKETEQKEQLKMILKSDVEFNKFHLSEPKLWHAISGAAFVKEELGITDKDIINSIRYHTTGRKNMSLLEKVIFVADFIGEERDYEGVDEMREAADESLEKAMLIGISFSIKDLVKRQKVIDINTIEAYNELLGGINK